MGLDMAQRLKKQSTEHDEAIRLLAQSEFDLSRYDIRTNPGKEHNHEIDGQWPDIVALERRTHTVYIAAEVETFDSVTPQEVSQWQDYASLGHHFILYVPLGSCSKAQQLCSAAGIKPDELKWYSVVGGIVLTDFC